MATTVTFTFGVKEEGTCKVCGKTFIKKRRNQSFCSKECSDVYWKAYRAEYLHYRYHADKQKRKQQ